MFLDYKFKEQTPEETVAEIRSILEANEIPVEETLIPDEVRNCFSMRLEIEGTSQGQNGKGISWEMSLASGYAEFMERLQNGFLYVGSVSREVADYGGFIYAPDEVKISVSDFIKREEPWLDAFMRHTVSEEYTAEDTEKLLKLCCVPGLFGFNTHLYALPFKNLADGSEVLIPRALHSDIYFTNGTCAGNATNEALVQGLSEIMERYCCLKIMEECPVLPDIPQDYLAQFPECTAIIRDIEEKANCRLIIKDASFGSGFPVLAVALVRNDVPLTFVRFGSHPVFPIALERTLTELLQGRTLADLKQGQKISLNREVTSSRLNIHNTIKSSSGMFHVNLLKPGNEADFQPFEDRSALNNEQLLQYALDFYRNSGHEVYVRDQSSLGFPTFRIIVPGMSEIYYPAMTRLREQNAHNRAAEIILSMDAAEKDDIESLKRYLLYKENFVMENTISFAAKRPALKDAVTDHAMYRVLLADCALAADDLPLANKQLQIAKVYAPNDNFVAALLDAVEQKDNLSPEELAEDLTLIYGGNIAGKAIDFLNGKGRERYRLLFFDEAGNSRMPIIDKVMLAMKKAEERFREKK